MAFACVFAIRDFHHSVVDAQRLVPPFRLSIQFNSIKIALF